MAFRSPIFCLAALSAIATTPVLAGDAFTTRIEPRPFYGATVTIESGVRVFRPLPPTRQVIVNPDGATPLNLSYEDVRVTEESRSTSYNYNYNYDSPRRGVYGLGGFYGGQYHHGGVGGHKGHYGKSITIPR